VRRRDFLKQCSLSATLASLPSPFFAQTAASIGFQFTDVTSAAGIQFRHTSGAYGGKLLPETLGSGCAFIDYDADGWPDILLVNGMEWPGHKSLSRRRLAGGGTLRLYRNNRNGTFTDVTRSAGLDIELYGMGVAVGDFNNDGFPDLLITCVGQNRLFRNTGKGTFVDITKTSGLDGRQAFSTSAMWFDFDRDGRLDLFVCNYVKWTPEHDVFCSLDGRQKSYCTPEAYRGETCWLFHNRGDGTFEDVTATSGVFDSSSKSLGVTLIDFDQDGWADVFVANDTQPNKLYRNLRNGRFKDVALEAGVALSEDGKARAGMGVDAADFDNSGRPGLAVTNFDNEMIGLYRPQAAGVFQDVARRAGVGTPSLNRLGFGCVFADFDLDGLPDLVVANGHIDETVRNIRGNVGYAQAPLLFINQGNASFREAATLAGSNFSQPRVGRGLATADFDGDGDVDLLMTTNNGPAVLFRNDLANGNRSVRFRLIGTASNRDAIGATVRLFHGGSTQSRMVKGGSSYLSQSELPVTFGVGRRDVIDRVSVAWPNGRTEEFTKVATGRKYVCTEGKGLVAS
jgi:enediyne biosynthesis protein E4